MHQAEHQKCGGGQPLAVSDVETGRAEDKQVVAVVIYAISEQKRDSGQ